MKRKARLKFTDYKKGKVSDMKKNKKMRIGIVAKLIGMSALPVIILGIVLTVYGQYALNDSLKNEIYEGLKSAAVAVQGAYDAAGEGDYVQLESGNVLKGTFLVNNNYNLVDKMKNDSGIEVGFFYGKQQIVTSLTDGSERLIGLEGQADVIENVLNKGQEYFSQSMEINGESYYAYYMPVSNTDGTIVGMIFTGKHATEVEAVLTGEAVKMIGISALCIIVSVIVTIVVALSIVKALQHAIKLFGKVAEGDLTKPQGEKETKRGDEIGDMLHGISKLRGSMQEIIGSIQETADTLTNAANDLEETAVMTDHNSKEVGCAVEEIAKGAMSQAEETGNALNHTEKMGQMIEDMVADIHVLNANAVEMGKNSADVNRIVTELIGYTARTNEVAHVIEHQTQVTNSSTEEIKKAVEMISSIADETNLLSLNASIEAARAGEQGKGFAVVAGQIQKLAEQSNESAKQIEEIIGTLLVESKKMTDSMEEISHMVEEQKNKLEEAGERFDDLDKGIQISMERIGGIQKKSNVLDSSRGEILSVVTDLSAISEENASATEETTATIIELNGRIGKMATEAGSLKTMAEKLEDKIKVFQL